MRPEDFGLQRNPSTVSFFDLLNVDIETRAQAATPAWVEDITQSINRVVDEWALDHIYIENDIDEARWNDLYKPALLWRFHTHLAEELRKIGEGHETVMFNSLQEGSG